MKPVPSKKIVFVIVEGPSDDVALGYFLEKSMTVVWCIFILCTAILLQSVM